MIGESPTKALAIPIDSMIRGDTCLSLLSYLYHAITGFFFKSLAASSVNSVFPSRLISLFHQQRFTLNDFSVFSVLAHLRGISHPTYLFICIMIHMTHYTVRMMRTQVHRHVRVSVLDSQHSGVGLCVLSCAACLLLFKDIPQLQVAVLLHFFCHFILHAIQKHLEPNDTVVSLTKPTHCFVWCYDDGCISPGPACSTCLLSLWTTFRSPVCGELLSNPG